MLRLSRIRATHGKNSSNFWSLIKIVQGSSFKMTSALFLLSVLVIPYLFVYKFSDVCVKFSADRLPGITFINKIKVS